MQQRPWMLLRFCCLVASILLSAGSSTEATEPQLLANLNSVARDRASGDLSSRPGSFLSRDGRLYFLARTGQEVGVFETDGTPAGTRVVASVPMEFIPGHPGDDRFPAAAGLLDGRWIFQPGTNLDRLWSIDFLTGSVTELGTEICPRSDFESAFDTARIPYGLAIADDFGIVFTDGTPAGTIRRTVPVLEALVAVDSEVALGLGVASEHPDPGELPKHGLWRVDSFLSEPELVLELPEGRLGPLVSHRGAVYFSHCSITPGSGDGPCRIWRSEGRDGTHYLLVDGIESTVRQLAAAGDHLFYDDGGDLWRVHTGTGAVTRVSIGNPSSLQPFRGGILYVADTPGYGYELHWTAGHDQPRVLDLAPGPTDSHPTGLTVIEDRAYFFATVEERPRLATTDGTNAGTYFLDSPGGPDFIPEPDTGLAMGGEHLVFAASSGEIGVEPWTLDLSQVPVPTAAPEPPIPPPPRRLRATQLEGSGLRLQWEPPTGGDFDHYALEYRLYSEDEFHRTFVIDRNLREVEIFALARVPFVMRLRAVSTSGRSAPTNEVNGVLGVARDTCLSSDFCLDRRRYLIKAFWKDQRTGDFGRAEFAPLPGGDRSGVFWFFRPENVEGIVKLLDGTAINGHQWAFVGGLTDLEYFFVVKDTEAGTQRLYHKSAGDLCGLADTSALPSDPISESSTAAPRVAATSAPALSLLDDRYRVTVSWRDQRTGNTGTGTAVPGSDNTGYFWFFRPENIELVIKVLDGEPVNGHHWVFYGGITDLEYDILVEDLANGESRTYHHAPGDLCGGADTTAFNATE